MPKGAQKPESKNALTMIPCCPHKVAGTGAVSGMFVAILAEVKESRPRNPLYS